MLLNDNVADLESALNDAIEVAKTKTSIIPTWLKSKKGQFNGAETITINGPGVLYSYYFRWGERVSVIIDGTSIETGSSSSRVGDRLLDSSYGWYQYGSSVGWRSIIIETFSYSGKPGYLFPLVFNDTLQIKQRDPGSGTNDYYYLVYSTYD